MRTSPSVKFYQQRWELHNCLGTSRISPRRELNCLGGEWGAGGEGGDRAIQSQAGGFVTGRDSEVKSIKSESRLGVPEGSASLVAQLP